MDGLEDKIECFDFEKTILRCYFPEDCVNSKVLFVMHGKNRDGERYFNEWVGVAKEHKVLLVVPEFPEKPFDFEAYNLGHIDGKQINFDFIDGIFDYIKTETGNKSDKFNIYGHSSGGQFVHRMVLFKKILNVETAVAANSGWYTFPNLKVSYPCGFGGLIIDSEQLRARFNTNLTILLGEKDTNGDYADISYSEEIANQGVNRLKRGKNFHNEYNKFCKMFNYGLQWKLKIVKGAKHKNKDMVDSAVKILFG